MEDLFNQLKSQPSINRYVNDFPPTIQKNTSPSVSPTEEVKKKPRNNRFSEPPQPAAALDENKRRNSTPPIPMAIKQFKIRLNRTSVLKILTQENTNSSNTIIKQKPKSVVRKNTSTAELPNNFIVDKSYGQTARRLKPDVATRAVGKQMKMTPTKAQQKQFEPIVLKKAHQLKAYKLKRCIVRLQRKNLDQIQQSFKFKQNGAQKSVAKKRKSPPTPFIIPASPSKRGRFGKERDSDKHSNFFINAAALTNKKSTPINKNTKVTTKAKSAKPVPKEKNSRVKKQGNKLRSIPHAELVKTFGTRPFRAYVKMERCHHPLMVIFESNARARYKRTSQSKSKNLRVSFNEVVELFGECDDYDDDTEDELNYEPSTSQAALSKNNTSLPAMPTRLKKVENGKVVEDIELDQSILIHPTTIIASTPYSPEQRKMHGKKSFSPLKGDGTPSPRKERLKMANEKLPPSGLRRLRLDDEDDEDDEYIVPIDIPKKVHSQSSHSNSSVHSDSKANSETRCLTSLLPTETKCEEIVLSQRDKNDEPASSSASEDNFHSLEKSDNENDANVDETVQSPTFDVSDSIGNDKENCVSSTEEADTMKENKEVENCFASTEEVDTMKKSKEAENCVVSTVAADTPKENEEVEKCYTSTEEVDTPKENEEVEKCYTSKEEVDTMKENEEVEVQKEHTTLSNASIINTSNENNDKEVAKPNKLIDDPDLSDISDDDDLGADDLNDTSFLADSLPLEAISSKKSNGSESEPLLNLNDFNANLDEESAKSLENKIDDDALKLFVEDSEHMPSNFIEGVNNIVKELSRDIEIEAQSAKDVMTSLNLPISMDDD